MVHNSLNHGGSIDVNPTVVLNAYMARTDPQLKLRLPPPLKDWVDQRAEKNRRSLNAEIVHILEGVKERVEAPDPDDSPMGKEEFLEWLKETNPFLCSRFCTHCHIRPPHSTTMSRQKRRWSEREFLTSGCSRKNFPTQTF